MTTKHINTEKVKLSDDQETSETLIHTNYAMDKVQLQNQLQPKTTNYSNKMTCVKNSMCIAHDYVSKLNSTNPS